MNRDDIKQTYHPNPNGEAKKDTEGTRALGPCPCIKCKEEREAALDKVYKTIKRS